MKKPAKYQKGSTAKKVAKAVGSSVRDAMIGPGVYQAAKMLANTSMGKAARNAAREIKRTAVNALVPRAAKNVIQGKPATKKKGGTSKMRKK